MAGLNGLGQIFTNFGAGFSDNYFTNNGSFLGSIAFGLQNAWTWMSGFAKSVAGIGAVVGIVTAVNNAMEKLKQNSEDSLEEWSASADSVDDYKSRIEELKTSLDSGTLSEESAYEAKSELLSIQESLNDIYGSGAESLDLINGKYEEQIGLIDQLSAVQAKEELEDNSYQIWKSQNALDNYEATLGNVYKKENREAIEDIIAPFGEDFQWDDYFNGGGQLSFTGSVKDAQTELQILKDGMADLMNESDDDKLFSGLYNGVDYALNDANTLYEEWGTIYDDALKAEVMADTNLYGSSLTENGEGKRAAEWMQDYANAINDYNDALESGDEEEIRKAQENYRDVAADIEDLVHGAEMLGGEDEGMAQYEEQLKEIKSYLDEDADAAFNFYDALRGNDVEEKTSEEKLASYGEHLANADLTAAEFKNRVIDNRENGQATLYTYIADYAESLDISLDQLADALVQYHILSSGLEEASEFEPVTFSSLLTDEEGNESEFASQISTFQSDIQDLNDAQDSLKEAEENGESIDYAGLLLQFDGLSQYADDLGNGLSQLSIDKMEGFADNFNKATKDLVNAEELLPEDYSAQLKAANKVFVQEMAAVDMSAYDFDKYRQDISNNVISNVGENAWRYEQNVSNLIDSALERYGDNEITREILLKLSFNADFANWDVEELNGYIDQMINEMGKTSSDTLEGVFEDALGDATEFSGKVDTFQSDMESINSALDDLRNGEEVNVMDLVQDFPELANSLDNLEEGLSNLSIQKAQQFAKDWQKAFADVPEEDMDAVNKLFNETIADVDMSSVINKSTDALERYNDVVSEARSHGIEDLTQTIWGNTDADSRQVIRWNEENLDRFKSSIESMGESVDDFAGSYATALGGMEEFDGVEIAFTPMLQTPNGAELLDSYTVSEYINEMIRQLGEGWTPEQLLALDASGLDINGKHIQDLIVGIGDNAEAASWALHYLGDEGAIALEAMNNEVRDFALENMMNNALEKTGGSALTHQADLLRDQFGDVLDEVFAEYGTDQYAVEAIARLSLNPQAANWEFEDWAAQIEDEEVYVKINLYEDSIAQLENNLDLIESDAERIQNEMDRNDIYARQNGEQMYRDLINNGNLQLENLKSQLAYWQAIAAESDTTATYANAMSQIQSIESEINSVISSQQEWNAAAEALKYEAGDLLSEYSEATSTRNGGDSYSEILSALDATNELVEEGKWGVDEAQAGLKLASAAGIADITNWEQNYAHMQRYFTEDATGISNALSDLTEATNDAGEALATYDEATGDWFLNINNPRDLEAAAQAWGLNTEAAYSLVSLLSDYDFGVGYIESEEDGLYQLGAAYADLAQQRYKLNQMEKDSDKYSEEEIQAQRDIADKAEQTAQYYQDAVESWDQGYIDEMNEAAYGELLSELNTLPEVYEKSGSEGMSAFLDGMKEFANENGLEVDDLFTTGANGETLLSEEGYHALEERVGGAVEDISLSGSEAGGKFGEALVNSMGEAVDEEGTTIQGMAESIAKEFSGDELGQIKFNTGEYTKGVEEAEKAVDGLLEALGLTQEEGEEAVEFLKALQEGDWDSAMEFLTRAEEVQGKVEDYLYNPEVAAEVEPKVESALELGTPEQLLGLGDEALSVILGIDYEVDENGNPTEEVQQELNEARREIEGEELKATVNTVVESNEEIESAEDLLDLTPEELEVAFEPVLEGSDLDISDIESYLGYEEPEIPVTVKMDEEQFGDLSALLNPEESVPVTAELEEGSVQSIEDELNGIEGTAHVSVEFGEGIDETGLEGGGEPYSWQADETGTISIPATLNIQIEQSDLEEALNGEEEETVTVKSEWEQAAAPQTEEIITGTVDYEVGTVEEPDDPTAEGTVDYEPGDIEEPEGITTEGIVNYETGSVEEPDITTTDETVNVSTNINDSGVSTLEGEINSLPDSKTVDVTVNAEPGEVSSLEGEVDSVNGKTVDVTANVNGTAEVLALKAAIDSVYSKTVQVTANVSGTEAVYGLASAIASVQSKTVTVTTVTQTINGGSAGSVDTSGYATSGLDTGTQANRLLGTAHASGTAQGMRAYAGGGWNYWALPKSEKAIVNEIGNESIVRNGRWMMIPGGTHVESLRRGDIIFNADQTRELLENGRVVSNGGHGKVALADGTAYNMMNAHSIGGNNPTITYNGSSSSSSSSSSSGSTVVNNTTNNYYGGGSSSSGGGSDAADEAASEIAEDFEDWFSNLFDWIEVTLQHLTDQISLYIKKAENALDYRWYNTSASYYQQAISDTITQIGNESSAAGTYWAQAEEVLNRSGIDGGTIDDITNKYKNGSLTIDEYSEDVKGVVSDYIEFADKARDAEMALEDLNADVIEYIQNLKDLRDAQRDATIEMENNRIEFATSTYHSSQNFGSRQAKSQYSFQIRSDRRQNAAYTEATKNVNSDFNTVRSSARSALSSAAGSAEGKEYRDAIETAQKKVAAKKEIPESTLNTITANNAQLGANLIAYNQQLYNLETAREEEALNYAANSSDIYDLRKQLYDIETERANNKISYYSSQASNTSSNRQSAMYNNRVTRREQDIVGYDTQLLNSYMGNVQSNAKTINKENKYQSKNFDLASTKKQDKINKLVDDIQESVNQTHLISANKLDKLLKYYDEGYISRSFMEACVDYNNALEYKREAQVQKLIDEQTLLEQKKSARESKRDNAIDKYQREEQFATSSRTYTASSKNSQLSISNKELQKDTKAYQKAYQSAEADLDYNTSGSTANTMYESLQNGKKTANSTDPEYLDALKQAKKYVRKGVAVPDDVRKEIGKHNAGLAREILLYNDAVAEAEYEREEYALELASNIAESYDNIIQQNANLNEEANNKIDLYELQSSNAEGASGKNPLLDQVVSQYEQIVKNDESTLKKLNKSLSSSVTEITSGAFKGESYSSADSDTKKEVRAFVRSIRKKAKKGEEITSSEQKKMYKYFNKGLLSDSFVQSVLDYIDALASVEEMEAQMAIDEATEVQQKLAKGEEKVQNVEQDYENLRTANNDVTEMLKAKQNTATTRGIIMTEQDYRDLMEQNQIDRQIYVDEAAQLRSTIDENLENGWWTTESQEYLDAIHDLQQLEIETENCDTLQEEYNNSVGALPYEAVERLLDSLEKVEAWYKAHNNLLTTSNIDLQVSDYENQLHNYEDQLEQLHNDLDIYYDYMQKALEDPDQVYYGHTYEYWRDMCVETDTEIQNMDVDFVSLCQDMRDDVFWRDFERAHDAAQRFEDVLSGIVDLITDDMMFNYDGDITEYGIAQLGNYMKELEQAETEVQNYMNDLENLNKLYEEGFYGDNELTYAEQLAEIQEGLLDAAGSVQGFTQDIIDVFQTYAQNQLDKLFELIEVRQKDLESKKS